MSSIISLNTSPGSDNVERIKEKTGSKVRIRTLLGRLFNANSDNDQHNCGANQQNSVNEISSPYNTVHRIHVNFIDFCITTFLTFRLVMMDRNLLACRNHGWKCYSVI